MQVGCNEPGCLEDGGKGRLTFPLGLYIGFFIRRNLGSGNRVRHTFVVGSET